MESDGIDESSTTTVAVVVARLPELSVTVRLTISGMSGQAILTELLLSENTEPHSHRQLATASSSALNCTERSVLID